MISILKAQRGRVDNRGYGIGKGFSGKMLGKNDMHRIEGEYDNHEIYIQQDALFVFGHSFADRNDCLCQA